MCRKPNSACTGNDLKLQLAEKMTKLTPRHGQHVYVAKGFVMAKAKQIVLFYPEKIRQIQTLRNTENGLIKHIYNQNGTWRVHAFVKANSPLFYEM